jgi:hypothetical protein
MIPLSFFIAVDEYDFMYFVWLVQAYQKNNYPFFNSEQTSAYTATGNTCKTTEFIELRDRCDECRYDANGFFYPWSTFVCR